MKEKKLLMTDGPKSISEKSLTTRKRVIESLHIKVWMMLREDPVDMRSRKHDHSFPLKEHSLVEVCSFHELERKGIFIVC